MSKKPKTVMDAIEQRRDDESTYICAWVRELGGDGLCCPGECGCSLDEFPACEEALEDLECVPATGEMGEWEGMPGMVYTAIDLEEPSDESK